MRKVKVAATQMSCSTNTEENIENAEKLIRHAAKEGANIIQIQELFENIYFCQEVNYDYFKLAHEVENHPILERMSKLAKELNVVLPISFFEKSNNSFFNSVVVYDADGTNLGKYRKTHIPDDPGYYEKFYFSPGDTGFKVFDTKFAKIGIGICWDQWFPETARCLVLKGAEILFYPTAIGTFAVPVEDIDKEEDDYKHWQNTMLGHAAANMVPVVASNRIGIEKVNATAIRFYGASFISDYTGEIVKEANTTEETVLTAEFDLDEVREYRIECVVFRDRRPECYGTLLTLDGKDKLK